MADRDSNRTPRGQNVGTGTDREEGERGEGDRSMSRNYSREDMRRYGRQSQEQGERLRRLRGQSPGGRQRAGGQYAGGRELYRGYGPEVARREGRYEQPEGRREQRAGDEPYDAERDYRSAPYAGRDMNLEGRGSPGRRMRDPYRSRGGQDQGWDVQDERNWREEHDWPSGRDFQADIDWQRTGGEFNRQQAERRGPQDSGENRYDNFWGARRSRQRGGQQGDAPWWDTASGRPGYTSARGGQPGAPYRGEADWEEEREYDMDPGFSYEFGTDFNFLNEVDLDAERQRHQRRRERQAHAQRGQHTRRSADWNQPGPYSGIGPSGYQRSDERVMEEICEIFTRHGKIDASGIDIQVENGQVELRGEVDRREEKYLAEEVAARVMGVKDVQNHLRVQAADDVRGIGRENVVMPGRIQARMRVAGVDGKHIGTVQEVHADGFTLKRSEGDVTFIPFRAVKRTNGQIFLHVTGSEIDRQGWKRASS